MREDSIIIDVLEETDYVAQIFDAIRETQDRFVQFADVDRIVQAACKDVLETYIQRWGDYDEGYCNGEHDGYEYGYDEGYDNGYQAGKEELKETVGEVAAAYDEGYADGFSASINAAFRGEEDDN